MLWKVWRYGIDKEISVTIEAESFDEAISIARQIDSRFSAAQVIVERSKKR